MLQVFEQRNKVLLTKFPSHFVEDVLRRTDIPTTNYNFKKINTKSKQVGHIKFTDPKSKKYQAHQEFESKFTEDKL